MVRIVTAQKKATTVYPKELEFQGEKFAQPKVADNATTYAVEYRSEDGKRLAFTLDKMDRNSGGEFGSPAAHDGHVALEQGNVIIGARISGFNFESCKPGIDANKLVVNGLVISLESKMRTSLRAEIPCKVEDIEAFADKLKSQAAKIEKAIGGKRKDGVLTRFCGISDFEAEIAPLVGKVFKNCKSD